VGVAVLDQLLHDEGLKDFQGDFLGHAALVELEFRPDHDNRTAGIVDALAQEVLAEAALLTAQHIRKALEGPVSGPCHRTAAASVVNEGVHRFLEHTLLVAHDDVRRAQFQQALQAVVPVDDAAVEIV